MENRMIVSQEENPAVVGSAYIAIVCGATGAGKSTILNILAGNVVAAARASATSVTQIPEKVYDGILNEDAIPRRLILIDAPGLSDPTRTDVQIVKDLTALMQHEVTGIDTIFHVIRMGRLTDADHKMPLVILNGLACNSEEVVKLAKRYKVIVTGCDSAGYDEVPGQVAPSTEIKCAEFRGAIEQIFPTVLKDAARNAIFVENNSRMISNYNDKVANRATLLQTIFACRVPGEPIFVPALLQNVIDNSTTDLQVQLQTNFSGAWLETLSHAQTLAILHFFQYVKDNRVWVAPRSNDNIPQAFADQWNALNMVVRDEIAVSIADAACAILATHSDAALERELKRARDSVQPIIQHHVQNHYHDDGGSDCVVC